MEERNLYSRALESAKKTGVYYEPRIKEINGKFFDIANLEYKDLPEKFKFENKESARVTVEQIKRHLTAGGELDDAFLEKASSELHDEWLKRNGSWASAEQKLPFNELSKVEADKDRVIIRKGMDLVGDLTTSAERSMYRSALKSAAKLGAEAVLVAGGVVGLAAFAALELAGSSTPTACQTPYDDVINRDPHNNCAIVHEVDGHVLKFLDEPESLQVAALKDKKVCDFYRELNNKLLTRPSFVSLKCGLTGFELVTQDKASLPVRHKALYVTGTRDIRSITLAGGTERGATYVVEVNRDGTVRNASRMAKVLVPLKLYFPEAQECCAIQDDQARSVCLTKLNAATGGAPNTPSSTMPESSERPAGTTK